MGFELEQAEKERAIQGQAQPLHTVEEIGLDRSLPIQPDDPIASDIPVDLEVEIAADPGPVQAIFRVQFGQLIDQSIDLLAVQQAGAAPPALSAQRQSSLIE